MKWAASERVGLCDAFDRVGPDAPTLCAGWRTHDLAAHLVARETHLLALPGLVLPGAPRRWTEAYQARERARPFAELVAALRAGPPAAGAFGLPVLREEANILEFYVHHEDVLRAGDGPTRELPEDLARTLWRRISVVGHLLARSCPVPLTLVATDVPGQAVLRRGGPDNPGVRVLGRAGELVLALYGRQAAAQLDVHGAPGDVEAFRNAQFGV